MQKGKKMNTFELYQKGSKKESKENNKKKESKKL